MLSSFQEGAMNEALHTLRKSRAGHVSAMTNACSQIDILLVDYANLVKVKSLQSTLDKAWRNFQENVTRCKSLLDENSDEIYEVDTQYATQETRKYHYDLKIEQYAIAAATHFNEKVSHDLANFGLASPARSLRSATSRASSKLSEASARLHDTRATAAKAELAAKQTEQERKRSIEIEMKRLEMEMSQKRVELELAKLEADRDVAEAKERTEIAESEAKLAEAEYSELMLNAQSSSHSGYVVSGLALGITSNTSSLTTLPVNTFPVMSTQAHTLPAVSTQAYALPAVPTQAYTPPSVSTQAYTLPAVSTQAYTFPAVSTKAYPLSAVSSQAYTLPAVSSQAYTLPAVYTQAYTRNASSSCSYGTLLRQCVSSHVHANFLAPNLSLANSEAFRGSFIRVFISVGPAMFSVPSCTADFSRARVVPRYDPVVPPHHSAPGLSAAASSYNYTSVSSVADVPQCILPTPQPVGEISSQ